MTQIAEIDWHVSGDIGGTGVSRFRFIRQNAGDITGADVNSAAAASRGVLASVSAYTPSGVTWSCQPQVNIYTVDTGLVVPPLVITSVPTNVSGAASGSWGAGVGGRLNWKTSTLAGRRLLKGATFLVPFAAAGFAAGGGVASAAQTAVNGAAATYLTALTTALLYPVIWHRPPKGTFAGGVAGIIVTGILSPVPAGLRSRRS